MTHPTPPRSREETLARRVLAWIDRGIALDDKSLPLAETPSPGTSFRIEVTDADRELVDSLKSRAVRGGVASTLFYSWCDRSERIVEQWMGWIRDAFVQVTLYLYEPTDEGTSAVASIEIAVCDQKRLRELRDHAKECVQSARVRCASDCASLLQWNIASLTPETLADGFASAFESARPKERAVLVKGLEATLARLRAPRSRARKQ